MRLEPEERGRRVLYESGERLASQETEVYMHTQGKLEGTQRRDADVAISALTELRILRPVAVLTSCHCGMTTEERNCDETILAYTLQPMIVGYT